MQSIHEKPKSHVRCTPCEQYRTAAGTLHLQRIMSASEKHFVHTQNTYDRFSRPHKAPLPQTLDISVERQPRLVLATDHPSLRRAPELARYGGLRPTVVCRLAEPLVLVLGPGEPRPSPASARAGSDPSGDRGIACFWRAEETKSSAPRRQLGKKNSLEESKGGLLCVTRAEPCQRRHGISSAASRAVPPSTCCGDPPRPPCRSSVRGQGSTT